MIKNSKIRFLIFVAIYICSKTTLAQKQTLADGKQLVGRVFTSLNTLKNLQYSYSRIVDAKSEMIYNKYEGKMQMLFTPKSKIGIFYLFEDNKLGITKYNGISEYYENKHSSEASKEDSVSISDLNARSFLNPSINTIKVSFEWLRNTSKYAVTTADTIINGKKYSNIYFQFNGCILSPNERALEKLESNFDFYYTVVVDAATLLPFKIIRKYSLNTEDNVTTTFTNYEIDKTTITENIFTPTKFKSSEKSKIITEINSVSWELPVLNSNEKVTKQSLEGNVVMLEFFFMGCAPCKDAIPWLASVQEKYKAKNFKLFSVNGMDSKSFLTQYKKQNKKINYDILYEADNIIKKYNITFYPAILLLDKSGKVLYSGPLIKNIIEKLIKENL